MHIFYGRPLALTACVFALAAIYARNMQQLPKLLLMLLCFAIGASLLVISLCKKKCTALPATLLLCSMAAFLALLGSWSFFNRAVEKYEACIGKPCVAEGYVAERLSSGVHESRYRVKLTEWNGAHASEWLMLECAYPSALQIGDGFRLSGSIRSPEDLGYIHERELIRSDQMAAILRCEDFRDCSIYPDRESNPMLTLKKWNSRLSARLASAIGGEEGAISTALLLGNRTYLSDDTVLDFRRSGISHLLALSGLHVSVMLLIIDRLFLIKLRLPLRVRAVILPLFAIGYLFLTGGALSTVRAVVMAIVLYAGFLLQEEYDGFTAICAALMLILLIMPYSVCDISLWMSFFAAASILLFTPPIREFFKALSHDHKGKRFWIRILRALTLALAVGLFANAAILLLSAEFFDSTSLFSVPVTMLLSPLMTPALLLSLFSLLLPRCWLLNHLTSLCMRALLWVAEAVSDLPNGSVLLKGELTAVFLVLLAVAFTVCILLPLKSRLWNLIPLLLSVAVLLCGYFDFYPKSKGTSVAFISDGENDAVLLAEEKTAIAIDISDGSDAIIQGIGDALTDAKCTELEELVFTHYHSKMAYMIASLSADVKLRQIRLPEPITEDEAAIAERLAEEATYHGVGVLWGGDMLPGVSAELLVWQRGDRLTVEKPTLLMLRLRDRVVSVIGKGTLDGELGGITQNLIHSSDILFLCTHGTAPMTEQATLVYPDRPQRVILADQALLSYYPLPAGSSEYEIMAEYTRFFLK